MDAKLVPPERVIEAPWKLSVLVVEDDAADMSLILEALRRNASVDIAVAVDAADKALERLVKGALQPNLIFVDISMPRVNGFKFVRALREIPWMRDTSVVILTTSRFAHDVRRAQNLGACRYVVKPDSFPELETQIGTVVRQTLAHRS